MHSRGLCKLQHCRVGRPHKAQSVGTPNGVYSLQRVRLLHRRSGSVRHSHARKQPQGLKVVHFRSWDLRLCRSEHSLMQAHHSVLPRIHTTAPERAVLDLLWHQAVLRPTRCSWILQQLRDRSEKRTYEVGGTKQGWSEARDVLKVWWNLEYQDLLRSEHLPSVIRKLSTASLNQSFCESTFDSSRRQHDRGTHRLVNCAHPVRSWF